MRALATLCLALSLPSVAATGRRAAASVQRLELAVASGDVEAARRLLDAGADPNARDRRGAPVVGWLGSRPRAKDDDVLAAARLLDERGCDFTAGGGRLLANLAGRRMPKTLAFLASKGVADDYSPALRAIARGDDAASVKVLLEAGADPLAGAGRGSALGDAAWEGRTASVALMLARVKDKSGPKVAAAYQGAVRAGHADTARAFVDAGFKVPEAPARPNAACAPKELSAAQRRLLERLGLPNASRLAGLAGPMRCSLLQQCGELLLVDCNSAADGPAYYIDAAAPKVLATCGGACMLGCSNCPPKEWTCGCAR